LPLHARTLRRARLRHRTELRTLALLHWRRTFLSTAETQHPRRNGGQW
jgi:hypothetical protein